MSLTDAQIIDRAYSSAAPIRIPSAHHAAMLWAHFEFAPLAEPECEFNEGNEPLTPGLLGYLRGIPAYYSPVAPTVADAEQELLDNPESLRAEDYATEHYFAPGIYVRQVTMPAGHGIIGHEHKTEHLNVVLTGSALVWMDGAVQKITAPATFKSSPGVRKVLLILEDCTWQTIHPTHATDLDQLADELIVKSPYFLECHKEQLAALEAAHLEEQGL